MTQHFLRVEALSKSYPGSDGTPGPAVFDDVHFTIDRGEFVVIIGHSGCGKTTILNVLAGLEQADGGHVFMDGREVGGPSLERGVVFQGHALMPWRTVLGNVAFAVGSRWPQWSREQIRTHSLKFLEMVGLAAAAGKKPHQLSGGMKQRVGIARAFAISPKMLLLDEPFGALDALSRGTIQDELLAIVHATQQTVFMITHDVDEAILLADRILLMSNGPHAKIAEMVEVTMSRSRTRETLHHDPQYYRIRNHLVDFLMRRAQTHPPSISGYDAHHIPLVRPGLDAQASPEMLLHAVSLAPQQRLVQPRQNQQACAA
ncbi:ABC transporter ATP-binding protein [Thiomonas delicata]|uniref:Bicarbonate transport ATP-binding protein CmpD n=1 Tax=Thiomonas delicata TaxID=364030 RepID=A0A238D3V0_THIDL|nr:ABC transporter ATP-binding protein [Thiomonas delicata]SBP87925.1 Bicarbonate transport ATP-binding protein CmpD [Thiomonas delicata]